VIIEGGDVESSIVDVRPKDVGCDDTPGLPIAEATRRLATIAEHIPSPDEVANSRGRRK
jgi:hypothetical protein